jgi:hypothetical protein
LAAAGRNKAADDQNEFLTALTIARRNTMKLNYYDSPWPFEAQHSCDRFLIQYLREHKIENQVIFHFGTGAHHFVGKDNYERGNPNEILGITVSKEEHEEYVKYIIDNPKAANGYKVLYADIYTLTSRILPNFDLVSLFHLGDCFDEQPYSPILGLGRPELDTTRLNSAYAPLDDLGVLRLFISKLNPGGKIMFNSQSQGFTEHDFIHDGNLDVTETCGDMLVCQPVSVAHAYR